MIKSNKIAKLTHIIKGFLIVFIYLIIIVYSVEVLLYCFLGDEQKSLINIKEKRIELAKKKNINYDNRSEIYAYLEEKKRNENLSLPFYFNRSYFYTPIVQEEILKNKLIPFRGPINQQTLSCAEDLKYKLINNDKYGFKNPNLIYKSDIKIALIGDSYAEGLCENEKNDISGHLRHQKINTINLGVTGSGPLLSLAILREYLKEFKPNYVVYLYFEGNDLYDLNWEKETYLLNYLNPSYSLDYITKTNQFDNFLKNYQINKNLNLESIDINKDEFNTKENNILPIFKDILEVQNIKGILRSTLFFDKNTINTSLYFEVLNSINEEAKKNNSELIFIYLPSWSRYFIKYNKDELIFNKKKEIINFVKKNQIKLIDFEKILSVSNNKKKYFPLGFVGHYNKAGYNLIADLIIQKINE
ncbi:hypothetical protein N9341_04405 [Candidatus Pelagibacter sp.]|nr:hypothetical protein [Candidatus Pelagibacter sp.]